MEELDLNDVCKYVEENIETFHRKRIQSLETLELSKVLKRKNPYLYKAKCVLTADQIVRSIVDAHISSNEETIFGDWLEGLAIFINKRVFGGEKSGIPGMDLEFEDREVRNIVTIKSGPNWGNSSQIAKMRSDFRTVAKTLRSGNSRLRVKAVNGCCYGKDDHPDKGDYFKYCGREFWKFISGNDNLYLEILKSLGGRAEEKNEDFIEAYNNIINKFVKEFTIRFCKGTGEIDWEKLVKFNSL